MELSSETEIETEFARLPTEAQLSLLERLLRRVRLAVSVDPGSWESDLKAMAGDPEIQNELRQIETEFRVTETDGLNKHG